MAVKAASGLGKKAIFFTLSSVLIVSLFLLYYSTREDLSIKEKAEVGESRVAAVNNFVENVEQIYLPRAVYTSTNKAISVMTEYMVANGVYTNMSVNFPQVLMNGTLCNLAIDPSCTANVTLDDMSDYRLGLWLAKLTNVSREEMNIKAEFNISRITINQSDPWSLNVTALIDYNISSPGVVTIIGRNVLISTAVGIEGFTDPLIAIETGGMVRRMINRSIIDLETEKGSAVVAKLVAEKTYIYQNRTGPSFLMRFEKNLNASKCCGIESLITEDILDTDGDNIPNPEFEQGYRSYADFQFWMDDPAILCMRDEINYDNDLYNVTPAVSTELFPFKLDRIHMDTIYGVPRTSQNDINMDCSLS